MKTRLIMKAHAFVRSNIPRVLQSKIKCEESSAPKPVACPEFKKFVYFSFAPTLIYRDNYPQNAHPVQWDCVANNLGEIFVCIIYAYCLFDRCCVPIYKTFEIRKMTVASYINLVSMSIIPGGLILVSGKKNFGSFF